VLPLLKEVKLFSGTSSKYLSEKIADFYGAPLGNLEIKRFSDGEMQPVIQESVRGAYVFFIQSTIPPSENIMELLLSIDAAKRASAGHITAVIPYFGYARQDRKDKPRVPISAKLLANVIQASGANRIMTMDLHADQIQGFFDMPVDHLKSEAIYIPFLEGKDLSNVTFASPDVGGVKRARTYSKHFDRPLVICDKYREKANEVAGMTVIGDVKGAHVILVDDMVDTAGTLCRAAKALIDAGAEKVSAMCTHPVLSGKAYDNLNASVLEELVVCDTIPLKQESDKIKVLSTAKLFARAIRNMHEHRSISALFVEG
jgi:ribose-phosphate pyrophosphokinase